jgi:hypothetical protein
MKSCRGCYMLIKKILLFYTTGSNAGNKKYYVSRLKMFIKLFISTFPQWTSSLF